MNSIQSLVIIGSGNAATRLTFAFKKAGLEICGIYSRKIEHAQVLADQINAKVFFSIDKIPLDADAYLLAVSDSALTQLLKELPDIEGILMHTSGSVGLDVFPARFPKSAVFYPLQTLSKDKAVDFLNIPILIESKDEDVFSGIQNLATKISAKVKSVDSKQRKQIHLAAVFACNFSNYMFHIAHEMLTENDLDFDLLKPLIKETIEKLDQLSPQEAQTGPAYRQDIQTLDEHLEILKEHPEYQHIYHLISNQIKKLKA